MAPLGDPFEGEEFVVVYSDRVRSVEKLLVPLTL